jgi:hypothetical protein
MSRGINPQKLKDPVFRHLKLPERAMNNMADAINTYMKTYQKSISYEPSIKDPRNSIRSLIKKKKKEGNTKKG